MASTQGTRKRKEVVYPTSDGRPMAETDWHRDLMMALIKTLEAFYLNEPTVYVSGNLLVFYKEGDGRKHLSPDVFVVKGVPKRQRPNYLIWEEGKPPEVVIELTSRSTRAEDLDHKFTLYRDTLRVREYFLFDPLGEYLDPPLQGHRLRAGQYVSIRPVNDRLPSQVLGLHLERSGGDLRLHDPTTGAWLPTPEEARAQAEQAREQAEEAREQEVKARRLAEEEIERLRREMKELRRRLPGVADSDATAGPR